MSDLKKYSSSDLGIASPVFFDGVTKPVKSPDDKSSRNDKVVDSLEAAIKASGLKDGMTISFHHAFRGGDKTVNMVVAKLAEMGFKNLTLASSSLSDCHTPLIEHIKNGVVTKIFTSGLRGALGEAISQGIMDEPVQIHSHGGRANLILSGEISIDVAFLGVPCCDDMGNANGISGKSRCGSLGYAMPDAEHAKYVILMTEEIIDFPHFPASIHQDQVDCIVKVDEVGDPSLIAKGAIRFSSNPRELLIARWTAEIIKNSGYFKNGFSMQMGTGGASLAVSQFLEKEMEKRGIVGDFALGGITGHMVKLLEKGLFKKLHDVQSFDGAASESISRNENHIEISANEYANFSSKGASVNKLGIVILSALEIDTDFNVNVITGSNGVFRGASGGHSDTAAGAALSIIVSPLVRGRIPTLVDKVTTVVTPGSTVDVLVTDHGIAINPLRKDLIERLSGLNLPIMSIAELKDRAESLTGKPEPLKFGKKIVGVIRYRDGRVIDVVRQVTE